MNKFLYEKFLKARKSYGDARKNILTLIIFTVVSMVLITTTQRYFLCGISLSAFGLLRLTPGGSDYAVMMIASTLLIAVYLTFYVLSKKRYWAMIVLLVLLSVDCSFTFAIISNQNFFPVVDFIFHIICVIALAKAISAGKTLKDNFTEGVAVTDAEIRAFYQKEKEEERRATVGVTVSNAPQKDVFGYDVHTVTDSRAELRCRCCGAPRKNTDSAFCEYCGAPFAGSVRRPSQNDKKRSNDDLT